MATKEQHVDKAVRNAAFAKALNLNSQTSIEWAFTSLFYSGMHYVEAYLVHKQVADTSHDSHAKREKLIASTFELRSLHRHYMELKRFSMNARYFCISMKESEFTADALTAHAMIEAKIKAVI